MYLKSNEKCFILLLQNSNCSSRSFGRIWGREIAGCYCEKTYLKRAQLMAEKLFIK
jgi:hypothetical protein